MADPELWALMQRVETYRYRAERVEATYGKLPEPWREIGSGIAAQWRLLAEDLYARSKRKETWPVSSE
jgi:hypothetical protein